MTVAIAVHEERITTLEEDVSSISGKIDDVDEKLGKIASNDLPHIREGVTALAGKVENATMAWEGVSKKLETHWPKSLAILLALLSSAVLTLIGIVVTLILTRGTVK